MSKPSNANFPMMDMDFWKNLTDMKVPGMDMNVFVQAGRRNMETANAVNQLVLEGVQALVRSQIGIFRQSVEEVSCVMRDLLADCSTEEKMAKQADLVKNSYEKTLANVREISEIVVKSNTEASDLINKRVSESLTEFKSAVQKAKKAA
ncbi:MAG: phasin family protein [Alphaproteobacteria bacterium]